jgi:hypothetical protein
VAVRNRLNGNPSLATELRKILLWLTLACLEENLFENRSIGLVGLAASLSKTIEMGVVPPNSGRGFKFSRALRTQVHNRNPLPEILDPPL